MRLESGDLCDWEFLQQQHAWETLLVGNGLSINIWSGFDYRSLVAQAPLSAEVRRLFDDLETANFEHALEYLHHAHVVLRALGEDVAGVDMAYESVRSALLVAISATHIPWQQFPSAIHEVLASVLDRHKSVFTTNYDLCLYWSHLELSDRVDIIDFFWGEGGRFDPTNCKPFHPSSTTMHYLHGGLHLWHDDLSTASGKWSAAHGHLLDLESKYRAGSSRRPLFVTEGSSKAKLRAIRQSDYLSFCLDALRRNTAPTVVFGHSLSNVDAHVVEALCDGPPRPIAVSMREKEDPDDVIHEKVRVRRALKGHQVVFFDASTHPLARARVSPLPEAAPSDG